jgi:hypothetical protein
VSSRGGASKDTYEARHGPDWRAIIGALDGESERPFAIVEPDTPQARRKIAAHFRSSRALRLLAVAALVAGGKLGDIELELSEDVLKREIGETWERVILIRRRSRTKSTISHSSLPKTSSATSKRTSDCFARTASHDRAGPTRRGCRAA